MHYSITLDSMQDDKFKTLVINRRRVNETTIDVFTRVETELTDAAYIVTKFTECELTQDEFDGLCEYVVVNGAQAFLQSHLLRFINTGLLHRASKEFHKHEIAMQVNNVIASYKFQVNAGRILAR